MLAPVCLTPGSSFLLTASASTLTSGYAGPGQSADTLQSPSGPASLLTGGLLRSQEGPSQAGGRGLFGRVQARWRCGQPALRSLGVWGVGVVQEVPAEQHVILRLHFTLASGMTLAVPPPPGSPLGSSGSLGFFSTWDLGQSGGKRQQPWGAWCRGGGGRSSGWGAPWEPLCRPWA